jgi:hypothetical protein
MKLRAAASEAPRAIHGRNRVAEFAMDPDRSRETAEPVLQLMRMGSPT